MEILFGVLGFWGFGVLGSIFLLLGFLILVYMTIAKLIYQEYGITERPLFFLGILTMIIGTQLFATGFLAELVARVNPERNHYVIEKFLNFSDKE